MTAPDFSSRLQALRQQLAAANYDGFLVPMADEYQSEYVPSSAQRLKFITGFTGSAGFAIVLKDKAAFFTDGRYTLQASQQVPDHLFSLYDSTQTTSASWLAEQLQTTAARIAYDPWLHTEDEIKRLNKALEKSKASLHPVTTNLVDAIWTDRPKPPASPVQSYDLAYAGEASGDKRKRIAAGLIKNNLAAAVITDPASVAWLLNIRGDDVPHTPLPLSFAILYDNGKVSWFVDPEKIRANHVRDALGNDITPYTPAEFPKALDMLAKLDHATRIDPQEAASWIVQRLQSAKAKLDFGDDPCLLPKACKNPIELQGMRNAHRRDGAALAGFLAWLDASIASGATITELEAEEKLAAFRGQNELYRGPSFDTIAGSGEHGAIVHYRATKETNRTLKAGEFFLLDSGGQYLDGTTDVTRTISIGAVSAEMRERFTRVLKGHISLAKIRFPDGVTGGELDVLARQYLWEVGIDYNHGTGHGVGTYLGVHEGPQGISRRSRVALKTGMVVSNEPGFYQSGAYGIRIENLQAVIETGVQINGRALLGFETLTKAPIDVRAVNWDLMTRDEIDWLNRYHQQVRTEILPLVDDAATGKWLTDVTKEK